MKSRVLILSALFALTLSAQQAPVAPELTEAERLHMRAVVAETVANRQAFALLQVQAKAAQDQAQKTDQDLTAERAKLIQSIVASHPGTRWVEDQSALSGHLEVVPAPAPTAPPKK